jgi:hypothetical protein
MTQVDSNKFPFNWVAYFVVDFLFDCSDFSSQSYCVLL